MWFNIGFFLESENEDENEDEDSDSEQDNVGDEDTHVMDHSNYL